MCSPTWERKSRRKNVTFAKSFTFEVFFIVSREIEIRFGKCWLLIFNFHSFFGSFRCLGTWSKSEWLPCSGVKLTHLESRYVIFKSLTLSFVKSCYSRHRIHCCCRRHRRWCCCCCCRQYSHCCCSWREVSSLYSLCCRDCCAGGLRSPSTCDVRAPQMFLQWKKWKWYLDFSTLIGWEIGQLGSPSQTPLNKYLPNREPTVCLSVCLWGTRTTGDLFSKQTFATDYFYLLYFIKDICRILEEQNSSTMCINTLDQVVKKDLYICFINGDHLITERHTKHKRRQRWCSGCRRRQLSLGEETTRLAADRFQN